jgi:hypothetical protein
MFKVAVFEEKILTISMACEWFHSARPEVYRQRQHKMVIELTKN